MGRKPIKKPSPRRRAGALAADIYRGMVEFSPTAQVLVDRDGKIELVNRRTESLFGYRREELLGRPVEVLLPERVRDAHRGHREAYSAAPEARAMGAGRELFGRRKDGSEVPVEIGLNPIYTPRGVYLLAAIVDITERRRAAAEAERGQQRFRLAVEAAPNAMVMVGGDGRIVLANAQAETLFGYAQAELIGQPIELLVPKRFRAEHVARRGGFMGAPDARAMGAGRDLYGVRKDGTEIPVEIGLNPIRADSETFVLAAIVDITERRELQRKLAQSEALAAVGTMAASLAHEIRNPLGSIVMAARSLRQEDLTSEDREVASGVLDKESQRLNRTLQDFLQFARPRPPKRDVGDLNGLVRETMQALRADARLVAHVDLDVRLDERVRPFPHDQDQLRQVLWNLLLNGIQAMDGRGILEVATRAEEDGALLQVVDSGPGLAPASADRIFDPFFTTKSRGTGLGLAICRRIVGAHGGRITADNAPGRGARFSVLLPVEKPRKPPRR